MTTILTTKPSAISRVAVKRPPLVVCPNCLQPYAAGYFLEHIRDCVAQNDKPNYQGEY